MEGNKDDALKCLRIWKESLESGDPIRARKFVTKAQRVDPSLSVDDLLSEIEKNSADRTPKDADFAPDRPQTSLRQRAPSNGTLPGLASTIVREIKRKRDYYKILGVEKSYAVEINDKILEHRNNRGITNLGKAPALDACFRFCNLCFSCLSTLPFLSARLLAKGSSPGSGTKKN